MWNIIQSEYVYKSPWLTVRKDWVRTEKGLVIDDFYVLEYPTWVNVIAITTDGHFVIERQYRHGIQKEVFELCAGACEKGESPIDAAKRELLEETGFGGGTWSMVGKYAPNPNSMNNWCYTFLAEGVHRIQTPTPEPTESIEVLEVTKADLLKMMQEGKLVEGIMLSPLWKYFYEHK